MILIVTKMVSDINYHSMDYTAYCIAELSPTK